MNSERIDLFCGRGVVVDDDVPNRASDDVSADEVENDDIPTAERIESSAPREAFEWPRARGYSVISGDDVPEPLVDDSMSYEGESSGDDALIVSEGDDADVKMARRDAAFASIIDETDMVESDTVEDAAELDMPDDIACPECINRFDKVGLD